MADSYLDQWAAQQAKSSSPQDTQGGGSDYLTDWAQKQNQQRTAQLRAVLGQAVLVNPDTAAKNKQLSNATGVPLGTVERNTDLVEQQHLIQENLRLMAQSPILRNQMLNPEFAKLAHKDTASLSGIEKTMQVVGGSAGRLAAGMTVGMGERLLDFSGFINDLIAQGAKGVGADQLGQTFEGYAAQNRNQSKRAQEAVDYFLPKATNSTEAGLYSGFESAGFNLATLPLAIEAAMLKGPQAAGQVMGAIAAWATGSQSYSQARDKGLGVLDSATYATPQAAAEYMFNKWSGGKFFEDVAARSPIMKMLVGNVTREVLGEEATMLTQNINEWLRLNPEKTVREFIAEQPDAMYQTLIATLVGSGVQTGAMKGIQKLADMQNKSLVNMDEITKLQNMMRIAAGSDLLEKDPQTFKEYVQAVADSTEGAPKSVWVDGRVLNDALAQSGVTPEQLATILPSVQGQLAEAVVGNSPVEIPVGELATAAGTPIEQAIMPHLRTSADGLSLTEAKAEQEQAQQFLQQEAKRIIGQAADQVQANAQAENVRQIIAEQLIATGRYSKDVADKGARLVGDFYTVMAPRMKMTPDQLYKEMIAYKVRSQGSELKTAPAMSLESMTENDWANVIGVIEGQARADGPHEKISSEDAAVLKKMVIKTIKDGVKAGKSREQIVAQIEGLTKGGIGNTGMNRINALIERASAANYPLLDQATLDDLSETLFKDQTEEERKAGFANRLKNPVTLKDGTRLSGFTDPVQQTTFHGYDKNGERITVRRERINPEDIVSSKDSNRTAEKLKESLRSANALLGQSPFDQAANGTTPHTADTITIDGKERPALNSNGQRIASTEEGLLNQSPAALPDWAMEKAKGARITDAVKKAAISLSPKASLAARNYEKLDAIFAKVPNPLASEEAWRKFQSLLVGDANVLGVPYNALKYAQSPQAVADYLARLRPDQLASRRAGFELGAKIRASYAAGEATPVTTGRLLLWAMLSRKAGAYPHEAAYMDLVNGGVDEWIEKAVNGTWTEADNEGYVKWSSEFMASKKGGVSPSAGVTSNANDFGRILLTKMSEKDAEGKTQLARLHDLIADQNVSTDDVRRAFFALGDGLGIQNKVLSFALLVTGRWDTLVLDRVQFTHLWGDTYRERAGQRNIYDKGLAAAGDGHFGLAVYEALARGMSDSLKQGYELAGLTGEGDGTLGAFHWDSWLVESSQAIGHPTIEALDTVRPRPDLAVRQGKFDTYSYNFEYRADGQYQIPLLNGGGYRILSPAEAQEFAGKIADAKTGVVPKDFKVSTNKTSPWVDAQGVNREKYDETLAQFGRPADATDVAPAGLADAGGPVQQRAADGASGDGSRREDRAGAAALPGAPVVAGASGPDPRLVAVAEQYARDNGIPFARQAQYAQVDPERAARIAAAYAEMQHAPQDPAVKEAYENLIAQTMAQYQALAKAGYQFWFIEPTSDPYSSPWDAMRDLRANQSMGVFPTQAGFGSGATEIDISDNPLMADTGLMWPYGGPNGELKPVLANDLFRAVHDAFGHGLEGAGFRAQGEENTWQAHIRLFTGSAKGAITSETRGQNSWLNYGPYGETNRTAKVEDTVFADQKTGLMPEWTWTEGLVGDMPEQRDTLEQSAAPNKYQQKYLAGREVGALGQEERAQYDALADQLEQPAGTQPARGTYDIASMTTVLNGTADLSTFLHETGHFFLDAIRRMVLSGTATPEVQAMYEQALKGLNVTTEQWEQWHEEYATSGTISDGMRAAHERWAETFELYLFTGKSPNPGTQSLFRTFAEWLKRVYGSMQKFAQDKGITLDADLKAVMDKMLATDEQIAEAEAIAGLLPDLDATGEAREKLNARSMRDLQWARNAVNKYIAALQKQARGLRDEIEEEVRAELAKTPVYAALRFIKKGEATVDGEQIKATTGHKLNTEAIKEMYPETMLARPDLTKLKGLTNKDGLHPDMLADSFGFPSGDALVRAILESNLESDVEGMTDQRMLERHGDLATPEAIAAAAIEAVHNQARAKSLATELAAQRAMLGARQDTGQTTASGAARTVNVLVEAAKAFAQNVIGRRSVKDLKKAAWAHLQAERRAAKAWEQATAAGDTQAAVQAKQDQMLNNAAVRAAQQAQVDVRAALELFKKVGKGNNEALVKRGLDPDVVNAARAILTAYGVAGPQAKSALEYLELVQKNDPAMFAAIQPSVIGALTNAKPFDELTVGEVQALRDEIESLWHLAKRSRQMEVDGNLLDREEVQGELRADMEDKGIPDSMPGDVSAITPKEQALRKLMVFRAAATRVENWAQGMGTNFTKFVFQPIKEAADRYRAAKAAHVKRLHELLKPIEGSLKKGEIEAPELNGYTFGKDTSGVGMAEVLHAIVHTGNDSNKRKLLLGRGWAKENADGTLDTTQWDAFVNRMAQEGKLTQAHYDFAQGVWDLFESTKPLAQKTHRDVFGRYFAEVTANAFTDPFGVERRGGYAPAITDTRIVSDAATRSLMETENQSMAYAFPSTSKGFTKGRVEYNKPLLLDLRVLGQHLDKVLLFSHMESPVNDVRRVLGAKAVSYGLNRIDPTASDNIITPWLNRAARQQVEAPVAGDAGLMRIFSAARQRAGMATMFANVANSAQQLTGFAIAAVKVKPTHLMSAAAQMIASPKQMIANVSDASVYMKERMENDVANAESAIRDILLDPSVYEKSTAWANKHAYFLQQAVDNAMGPVIWTAAFNQATEQGQSEKDAVRFADSVIRTTQGSTLPEDVSRIETGNAFVRMFTQFGGYFNMQANLLGTEFAKVAQELGVKKGAGKMLYITTLGFLAPAWVAEAIMQVFRGGPDDEDKDGEYLDDWLAAIFGWSTLRGLTAMIPGVGQTINAGVNAWNAKPYDDRMGSAPAISMVESAVRAPASVYKAIVEEGSSQKAVRDVASLISMTTGLPANAAARPLGYLAGVADNRITPTSGADMARGLVTGNASPQSK